MEHGATGPWGRWGLGTLVCKGSFVSYTRKRPSCCHLRILLRALGVEGWLIYRARQPQVGILKSNVSFDQEPGLRALQAVALSQRPDGTCFSAHLGV